jgi:CHAT domain-containing protein
MSVAALNTQLTEMKAMAERGRMAERLASNREFKKLILEEFLVQETARMIHLSTDPRLSVQDRADALQMAQASGQLKRFLQMTMQMGETALNTIPDLEEALEDARAEEEQDTVPAETEGDLA